MLLNVDRTIKVNQTELRACFCTLIASLQPVPWQATNSRHVFRSESARAGILTYKIHEENWTRYYHCKGAICLRQAQRPTQ